MKRSRENSDESDEKSTNKYQKKLKEEATFLGACCRGDLDLVKRWLSLGKVDVDEAKDIDGCGGDYTKKNCTASLATS